jgi:hypothetical protein
MASAGVTSGVGGAVGDASLFEPTLGGEHRGRF